MDIVLRRAGIADAGAIAGLLTQLGYPTDAERVGAQLTELAQWPEAAVVVACRAGQVVGVMQLMALPGLAEPEYLELRSLVVDAALRGQGIGTALLNDAKRRAGVQGQLRLRCNSLREQAHAFYRHHGLQSLKTQTLFAWPAD